MNTNTDEHKAYHNYVMGKNDLSQIYLSKMNVHEILKLTVEKNNPKFLDFAMLQKKSAFNHYFEKNGFLPMKCRDNLYSDIFELSLIAFPELFPVLVKHINENILEKNFDLLMRKNFPPNTNQELNTEEKAQFIKNYKEYCFNNTDNNTFHEKFNMNLVYSHIISSNNTNYVDEWGNDVGFDDINIEKLEQSFYYSMARIQKAYCTKIFSFDEIKDCTSMNDIFKVLEQNRIEPLYLDLFRKEIIAFDYIREKFSDFSIVCKESTFEEIFIQDYKQIKNQLNTGFSEELYAKLEQRALQNTVTETTIRRPTKTL